MPVAAQQMRRKAGWAGWTCFPASEFTGEQLHGGVFSGTCARLCPMRQGCGRLDERSSQVLSAHTPKSH